VSALIDISPVISPRIAVWPGDQAFSRAVNLAIARGHNIDLSAITTTVHVGAHADAPSHYAGDGATIDQVPLEAYYGPCRVMEVSVPPGARITPDDLLREPDAPRLLLRTRTFPDPETFNTDFASLSPGLVDFLAARSVVLVGIDTPSVDPFDDRELLAHHALLRHGMANLEGLLLGHVPAGRYTLIALPLRIEGADGAPVRAALIPAPC
jgi:arylformamidase